MQSLQLYNTRELRFAIVVLIAVEQSRIAIAAGLVHMGKAKLSLGVTLHTASTCSTQ